MRWGKVCPIRRKCCDNQRNIIMGLLIIIGLDLSLLKHFCYKSFLQLTTKLKMIFYEVSIDKRKENSYRKFIPAKAKECKHHKVRKKTLGEIWPLNNRQGKWTWGKGFSGLSWGLARVFPYESRNIGKYQSFLANKS